MPATPDPGVAGIFCRGMTPVHERDALYYGLHICGEGRGLMDTERQTVHAVESRKIMPAQQMQPPISSIVCLQTEEFA